MSGFELPAVRLEVIHMNEAPINPQIELGRANRSGVFGRLVAAFVLLSLSCAACGNLPKNGFSSDVTSDGITYVGEYKDGKPNGHGTISLDGDVYIGQFKDGVPNGEGVLRFSDGRKYVGQWKNADYNGQGTFTYASGEQYVGQWANSERSGWGELFAADGTVMLAGYWVDDFYWGLIPPMDLWASAALS